MSYDIYLKDPVTNETLNLPFKHTMTGGTYAADYDPNTDTWSPKPISEAHLNITYNYSKYYEEATDKDPRFAHDEVSCYYADGTTGDIVTEYGIRGIYGKTGADSIPMLNDMVSRIRNKYYDGEEWITTDDTERKYFNSNGQEIDFHTYLYLDENSRFVEEFPVKKYEGETSNYWKPTAANAIKALLKLLAFAKLRPDGIWKGD